MPNTVKKVEIQRRGLLEGALPHVDYFDAYRRTFQLEADVSPEKVCEAVLRPPGWVLALGAIRNALVAPLGLKRPSIRTASFPILARNENEVVMGMDDSHLDFRLSVSLERAGGNADVTLATAVQFHNRIGRAYFAAIKPFHRLIVRACMARKPFDLLGRTQ